MRQLLWKEWHEQGWKLAFFSIVLSAFAFIGLRTRIIADSEMVNLVFMPAALLLPLLIAPSLIPAERGEGSFDALAALPTSMSRVMAVKILTGIALCSIPLIAALAASLAIAGGREMTQWSMTAIAVRSICTAVMLLLWMMMLTLRLPTEARAAMIGVGIFMIASMASAGLSQVHSDWLGAASPLTFLTDDPEPIFPIQLAINLLIAVGLSVGCLRCVGGATLLNE